MRPDRRRVRRFVAARMPMSLIALLARCTTTLRCAPALQAARAGSTAPTRTIPEDRLPDALFARKRHGLAVAFVRSHRCDGARRERRVLPLRRISKCHPQNKYILYLCF